MSVINSDHLIIGAGVVGITLARQILLDNPKATVVLLEKEEEIGKHASGRNSGVLHSGIYYKEDSIKAKICSDGSKLLSEYCHEHKLPIKPYGKIILPKSEAETVQVDLLYKRALHNKAKVEIIDNKQLQELEPMAAVNASKALYCPETSVIESKAVLQHLLQDIITQGAKIEYNQKITAINAKDKKVITTGNTYSFGHLFNTAGLYSDEIAKLAGSADKYTILPFKGLYYRLSPTSNIKLNHLIYPVPDLNMPFLGVHVTKTIDGELILGPTAIPSLVRENYNILENISLKYCLSMGFHLSRQYIGDVQNFRKFVHLESLRFIKKNFAAAAMQLVPEIKTEHLLKYSKVGIRAQLFNKEKNEFVHDFMIESNNDITNILNAISPAFTCSLSFAKYILDNRVPSRLSPNVEEAMGNTVF